MVKFTSSVVAATLVAGSTLAVSAQQFERLEQRAPINPASAVRLLHHAHHAHHLSDAVQSTQQDRRSFLERRAPTHGTGGFGGHPHFHPHHMNGGEGGMHPHHHPHPHPVEQQQEPAQDPSATSRREYLERRAPTHGTGGFGGHPHFHPHHMNGGEGGMHPHHHPHPHPVEQQQEPAQDPSATSRREYLERRAPTHGTGGFGGHPHFHPHHMNGGEGGMHPHHHPHPHPVEQQQEPAQDPSATSRREYLERRAPTHGMVGFGGHPHLHPHHMDGGEGGVHPHHHPHPVVEQQQPPAQDNQARGYDEEYDLLERAYFDDLD